MKTKEYKKIDQLFNEVCLTHPAGFVSKSSNPVFLYDEAYVNHSYGKLLTLLEALGVIQATGESVKSDAIRSQLKECFWGDHIWDFNHSMCQEDYEAITGKHLVIDAQLMDEIRNVLKELDK